MRLAGLVRERGAVPPAMPAGSTLMSASGVRVVLAGRTILDDISLDVRAGEVLSLVGPNGAGKSTLLSVLSGDRRPDSGAVTLCGRSLDAWQPLDLARRRAMLPQSSVVSFPFTVRDVVTMGRAPWYGTELEDLDTQAVADAMAVAEVTHLADSPFTWLSGGEAARVMLARVLAQGPQVLLLDEPTASLDIRHQEQVLRIARSRAAAGNAVVVVMHDLGLAAAHSDRVVVMDDGRVRADGRPAAVLTEELLSDVYRHPVEVLRHPRTDGLIVLPRREAGGTP